MNNPFNEAGWACPADTGISRRRILRCRGGIGAFLLRHDLSPPPLDPATGLPRAIEARATSRLDPRVCTFYSVCEPARAPEPRRPCPRLVRRRLDALLVGSPCTADRAAHRTREVYSGHRHSALTYTTQGLNLFFLVHLIYAHIGRISMVRLIPSHLRVPSTKN